MNMKSVCQFTFTFIVAIVGIVAQNANNSTTPRPMPEYGIVLTTEPSFFSTEQIHLTLLPSLPEDVHSLTGQQPGMAFDNSFMELTACSIDYREKKLIVHDMDTKQLMIGTGLSSRLSKESMNFTTFQYGVGFYESRLAVDWVSHNVYYTDNGRNIVVMSPARPRVDNGQYKIIIRDQVKLPVGITVDPNAGYVFFTNLGSLTIMRCSLTGKDPRFLVTSGLTWPYDISADVIDKRIYWLDDTSLWSSDYDGNDAMMLTRNYEREFASIEVFNNVVMATDYYTGELFIYDKTSAVEVTSPYDTDIYLDVCMYHEEAQPMINDGSACKTKRCTDMCVVEPHTFSATCLCRQGFELLSDGVTCNETSGIHDESIVFIDSRKMCNLDIRVVADFHQSFLDTMDCFYTHADRTTVIRHLELIMDTRTVIFATKETLFMLPLDVKDPVPETLVTSLLTFEGIAYDWTNKDLYFTDRDQEAIKVMSLTTRTVRTMASGYSRIGEILVIPHSRKLYWTAKLNETHTNIYMANLDVTNITVIRQFPGIPTNFIDDSLYESILFHVDGDVHAMSYNGSEAELQEALSGPITSFAIYHNYYMATTRENNETHFIAGRTLYTSDGSEGILDSTDVVVSMKIQDVNLQPIKQDPCFDMNGGCQEICLPNGTSRQCYCSIGFTLGSDGTSCNSLLLKDNFILTVDLALDSIYMIPLDESKPIQGVRHGADSDIRSVMYNYLTMTIFYTSNEIWESTMDGKNHRVILKADPSGSVPSRMSLDSSTGNIYYTTRGQGLGDIGVVMPTGIHTILFIANSVGMKPRDIAVDPARGFVFWLNTGSGARGLYRSHMDGTNVRVLVTTPDVTWLAGVALDKKNQMVYLTDGLTDKIYSCTYDGANLIQIHNETDSGLEDPVFNDGYLYYTAWNRHYVTRINTRNLTDVKRLHSDQVLGILNGMDLYSSRTSVKVKTECSANNGGCSQFCFPTPSGHTCGCENKYRLLSDNKTCSNVVRCPTPLPNTLFPSGCVGLNQVTCNIQCATNYTLKPGEDGVLRCKTTTWDNMEPCTKIACTDKISHGSLSVRCDVTIGSVCDDFSCNAGFEPRSGVTSLTCEANGQWSVAPATLCQAKCPEEIRKGTLVTPCNRAIGDVCRFTCMEKYRPRGNMSQLSCQTGSQWDQDPNNVCEEILCASEVGGALIDTSCNRQVGEKCLYRCSTGYILNSQVAFQRCEKDGTWTNGNGKSGNLCIASTLNVPLSQTQVPLNTAIGVFVTVIGILVIVIIVLIIYLVRVKRNAALNNSPAMTYHTGKFPGIDTVGGIENPQYSEIHGPGATTPGAEANNDFGYTTLENERVHVSVDK